MADFIEVVVPEISIREALNRGLKGYADRPAYHFMDSAMTFGQLDREARRFAGFLNNAGFGPGDVVSFYFPNVPQVLIALIGAFKAGCTVNGVSPLLTPKELSYQLNDCQAKVLVGMDALLAANLPKIKNELPHLKQVVSSNLGDYLPFMKRFLGKLLKKIPSGQVPPLPGAGLITFKEALSGYQPFETDHQPDPLDTAMLMYTGGTTGPSKGCEITHRNLVADADIPALAFGLEPGVETFCSAFPFFHIAGIALLTSALANGYTQILVPDPRNTDYLIDSITKYQPSFVAMVPTLYLMLMDNARFKNMDMSTTGQFKACISGAAPFAPDPFQTLEGVVGKDRVIEAYGATESCSTLTANPLEGVKKLGSVGLPLPGNMVKIMALDDGLTEVPVGQEGEVIASGTKIMKGYLNKPEETAQALREFDGRTWLYTGDVGKVDEDGYLYIVDRAKDMILVGGYNVFSKIVEDRLYEHRAVEMCAVIGMPNPDREGDEMVKAVIQLSSEYKAKDPSELKKKLDAFCREELAPYKVPKVYEFTDAIPLTAVGKVDKKSLR